MSSPSIHSRIVFLPGRRFFCRRIALVDGNPVAAQVELALEALSPFPPAQLYYGSVCAPDAKHAFVFAAYRRQFSAEETASWAEAEAVVPDFIPWLLGPSSRQAQRHRHGDQITLVEWDTESSLPARISTHSDPAPIASAGSASETTGPISLNPTSNHGWLFTVGTRHSEASAAFLQQADVRDKSVLDAHRRQVRRDRWLWRVFSGGLAGLAACAALDLALGGGYLWLKQSEAALAAQAPAAAAVQSAQSLAAKLEDMAAQQLRPLEMLAVVNTVRPATVEFSRVSTTGLRQITIEALTAHAADLPAYETALRGHAAIERVTVGDQPRSREGLTTFQLEVLFKTGWFQQEAAP